jgi:hypothetical protein
VAYSDKVLNYRIVKCVLSSWDNRTRQKSISKTVNPGLSLDLNMGRSVRTRYALILIVDVKGTQPLDARQSLDLEDTVEALGTS